MTVFGIAVLAIVCTFAVQIRSDASMSFQMDDVRVENTDNPYTNTWTSKLSEKNGKMTASMKLPVKKDFPPDAMVKFSVTMDGNALPELDIEYCKAFDDEMVGKDIVAAGIPNIPSKCPITVGDWEFSDYVVDANKLPSLPDGKINGKIETIVPGIPPLTTIYFEGTISRKMKMG